MEQTENIFKPNNKDKKPYLTEPEVKVLIEKHFRRDENALHELIESHKSLLASRARLMDATEEEYREAIQELYLKLIQKKDILKNYKPNLGSFSGFLVKMFDHIIIDNIRKKNALKNMPEGHFVGLDELKEKGHEPLEESTDILRKILNKERVNIIRDAIIKLEIAKKLREFQASILRDNLLNGMTSSEIVLKHPDKPGSTIESELSRARGTLTQYLKKNKLLN